MLRCSGELLVGQRLADVAGGLELGRNPPGPLKALAEVGEVGGRHWDDASSVASGCAAVRSISIPTHRRPNRRTILRAAPQGVHTAGPEREAQNHVTASPASPGDVYSTLGDVLAAPVTFPVTCPH